VSSSADDVTELLDPLALRARARVGATLRGKWRLDALLGVGGMAAVYAGTHRNGSRAAIKILHTELTVNAEVKARFLREGYGEARLSVAHMRSPSGWVEPGQRPEFDEYTVVLRGALRVEHEGGVMDVEAGQGILARVGEWIRYSTPGPEGAEYIAVCLPAFSPETVHRDV